MSYGPASRRYTGASETVSEPYMGGDREKHGAPRQHPKRPQKENWRISLLAQAKLPRDKFVKPDEKFNSGVEPGALDVEITERTEHMARPPLRTLVINKREFSSLPTTFPDYPQRMDRRIESGWASMYNYYKKAKRELLRKASKASTASKRKHSRGTKSGKDSPKGKGAKGKKDKKDKGGKGKGKGKSKAKSTRSDTKSGSSERSEEEIEKDRAIWMSTRALPKPIHRPEPIQRGPIADLTLIKPRMDELAAPKSVTVKATERTVVDIYKVKPETLTYTATERVLELSRPPAFRLVKEEPYIPGAVKPGALQATASPRITELSVPRATVNAKEADLKEDPFTISPNALKYVATARILELARPITRK